MSVARMTADAPQAFDCVEMKQNGLNILLWGKRRAYGVGHFVLLRCSASHAYGTFERKLLHLNTINSLRAKTLHSCCTGASPRDELPDADGRVRSERCATRAATGEAR
jgi:hypothetical protein